MCEIHKVKEVTRIGPSASQEASKSILFLIARLRYRLQAGAEHSTNLRALSGAGVVDGNEPLGIAQRPGVMLGWEIQLD